MNFYKKSYDFFENNNIRHYIAIDIETTGLKATSDKILEIGAVYFKDGEVVEEFNMLINPGIAIPWYITKINGINNRMVKDAPSEEEVLIEFAKFLQEPLRAGAVACAHNANFDFSFLEVAYKRLDLNVNLFYLDTLEIARKRVKGLPNYKQATLENYFGVINTSSHRALTDATACGEILWKLLKEV